MLWECERRSPSVSEMTELKWISLTIPVFSISNSKLNASLFMRRIVKEFFIYTGRRKVVKCTHPNFSLSNNNFGKLKYITEFWYSYYEIRVWNNLPIFCKCPVFFFFLLTHASVTCTATGTQGGTVVLTFISGPFLNGQICKRQNRPYCDN